MTAVIFTHPPDYALAAISARVLARQGVRPVLAIDRRDPVPEVEGALIHRTTFPRRGNLNGKDCVRGVLATLDRFADEDDYVLKVDSDTLVLGLDWLKGRTEPAVGLQHPEMRFFFGAAYALRADRLPEYRAAAMLLPESRTLSEDVEIGKMLPGIHVWENRVEGCPFAGFSWKAERSIAEWARLYQVVVFQHIEGKGRKEIRDTMASFL